MSKRRWVLSGLLGAVLNLLAVVAGVSLIVSIRNDSARYLGIAVVCAFLVVIVALSKSFIDRDSILR